MIKTSIQLSIIPRLKIITPKMNTPLLLDYKIEKLLAQNKFGCTYLSSHEPSNQKVVLKKLKNCPTPESLDIISHINKINSNHFPQTQYIHSNKDHYIIRPYIEGSDLKTILTKPVKYAQLSKNFIIEAFINLYQTLHLLHQNGILHTDIKPANIIIKHQSGLSPKHWNPKNITFLDYERAIPFPTSNNYPYFGFSMIYSPPEQILKCTHLFSESIDIFATAIS